jgi:hypothetical protein
MEHALHRPTSTRSLVIPLVAALLGAGVATTTFAVVDDGNQSAQPTVVVTHASSAPATAERQLMGGRRP